MSTSRTLTTAVAIPAGADKQIQYNNAGVAGAEAGFEYDQTTNTLTVGAITATRGSVGVVATFTGGTQPGYLYSSNSTAWLAAEASVLNAIGVSAATSSVSIYAASAERGVFSSAGLTVTGVVSGQAASAEIRALETGTGNTHRITIKSGATENTIDSTAGAGQARSMLLQVGSTTYATVSSTGLAVTGTVATTDNVSVTKATGIAQVNLTSVAGTTAAYYTLANTGGTYYFGVENSTSTAFGATAYAQVVYAPATRVIQNVIGGTGNITTVSSTGLAVTGTVSSTVARTSGANANVIDIKDTVTGVQTAGFGTRLRFLSNGVAAESVIAGEVGGDGSNNQSQIGFYTQNVAAALTRQMTLNSLGNLGIGVTPAAWGSTFKALQINSKTALWGSASASWLSDNLYYDGTNFRTLVTGGGSAQNYTEGVTYWYTAPSVTGGLVATVTERMRLDLAGNLGLGGTPNATGSAYRQLTVGGTAGLMGGVGINGSYLNENVYFDGSNYKAIYTGLSSQIIQANGNWYFRNAPSVTGGSTATLVDRLMLDSAGNLGLGMVPSAWGAGWRAIQMTGAAIASPGASRSDVFNNLYNDGTNFLAVTTGPGSTVIQEAGSLYWYNSASVTAGSVATLVERVRIGPTGNMGLGTSTANDTRLIVYQNASADAGQTLVTRQDRATATIQSWQIAGGSEVGKFTSNGLTVTGAIVRSNTRYSSTSYYSPGYHNPGDTVFEINPSWSQAELQQFFGSTAVTWNADSTAPGGYAIYIDGNVSSYGTSNGFPLIPVDQDDEFYMECWIKNVGTDQTHYMGGNDFDHNLSDLGGNPGSLGYWVMSNFNPTTAWTKVSGYIRDFSVYPGASGTFVTGTKYFRPQALFNYTAGTGTRACVISGWKCIKTRGNGRRAFRSPLTAFPTTGIYTQVEALGALTTQRLAMGVLSATVGTFSAGTGVIQSLVNASNYTPLALNPSGGIVTIGNGATANSWGSTYPALRVGVGVALWGSSSTSECYLTSNLYYDGTSWRALVTGAATLAYQTSGAHYWYTAPSVSAGAVSTITTRMTLDLAGNLGIGVTPAAWGSTWKALQVGSSTALWGTIDTRLTNNLYNDGTNDRAIATAAGSMYYAYAGIHYWFNSASVSAGAIATTVERMRLDLAGNLGVGTVPLTWGSTTRAFQLAQSVALWTGATGNGSMYLSTNLYWDTANTDHRAIATGETAMYGQSSGIHRWYTSPSTSAGAVVVVTERLRLNQAGSLGLGGSSFGGGVLVTFLANATTVPTSNPTGGGILYVESGALKYRGSSGTITTLGVA